MITAKGQCVQKGIAIGKILIYRKPKPRILSEKITDTEEQLRVYRDAKEEAIRELSYMSEMTEDKISKEQAMIFSAHMMLLQEPDFDHAVTEEIVQRHHNASYAVYRAGEDLASFFATVKDNPYINERAADFRDVTDRVIRKIQHIDDEIRLPSDPVILLSDDFSAQEVAGLNPSQVLALVSAKGSVNSHASILARSLGITALVDTGIAVSEKYNDRIGVADAIDGRFLIDPEEELLQEMYEKQKTFLDSRKELEQLIGTKTETKSGKRVSLFANISSVLEAKMAQRSDAEGIGLFRSEYLFLNRQSDPSEEEQFGIYKAVVETMNPKPVVIRTLDLGADKQDQSRTGKEENPALGVRGIRLSLDHPGMFHTQLRAIFRASAFGNVGIMFPMIVSKGEVEKIRTMIDDVKEELVKEQIPFTDPKIGVMIETPAAALISDELAGLVDFFSIGTNDLTQYTLAMDRQNAALPVRQNVHHEAILKLIELTVQNAHKNKIPVAICGELAADSALTSYFLKIGVDELSVPVSAILSLRKWIRSQD